VNRRGVCIWFTGLSGAGKSTIAGIVSRCLERRGRTVTLLDGDVVRTHLSKGLGFSKDDRDTNIRRIGFVASEIVRHGGIAICAVVSPYEATRNEVQQQIGPESFVLVYVATPLEECERRDTKGLYLKARRGEIKGMTGIDDPYEPPRSPDVVLQTTDADAATCADDVERFLETKGLL
jgi:sulfate adenylyltransferase